MPISATAKTKPTMRIPGWSRAAPATASTLSRLMLTSATVGLENVKDVAAGQNHSCVVKADGTVACWGLDTNGQLGLGIRHIVGPVGVRMSCPAD